MGLSKKTASDCLYDAGEVLTRLWAGVAPGEHGHAAQGAMDQIRVMDRQVGSDVLNAGGHAAR
jgi:hypothetical protein